MYCKKCGSEISKKADFCPKCGMTVPKSKHFRKTILILSACTVIIGAVCGMVLLRNKKHVSYYTDLVIQEFLENEKFKSLNTEQKYNYVLSELNALADSGEIITSSIIYDNEYQSFWFEYADHSEGVITLNDFSNEYDSGSATVYQKENSDNNYRPNILAPTLNEEGYPYNESNLNALIIDCLSDSNASLDFYEECEQWTAAYLKTDIITDISVEQLKTALRGYKFVNIRCHGNFQKETGNQSNICLTEKITKEKDKKYKKDLKNKTIFKANGKEYWIHPKFFTKYYYGDAGLFDSIIWVGCCNGYQNDTLVSALCNSGAKAVIGSTETVLRLYGTYMSEAFIFNLLCGDNVETSLEKAKSIWGSNDRIFYPKKNGTSTAEFRYYNGGNTTLVTLISENITVKLPDVNDIFYSYIESDLIPLYGLSEMHTESCEYTQEPNYSGLYGIVSAAIKQIGTEKYMVTVRLDKQEEISYMIFELYRYSDSKIEKIDTYNFKLEDIYETASYNKYTYLFNIGWSDDYLCFESYHYVYRSDRGGISYHILTVDKEGFKDNYELFERYNTPVNGGYTAFYNNNRNYIEVTNGLVDENEVSAAIEAIKKDIEAAEFYNYRISRAEGSDALIDFKIEYDEDILSYSLYDQIINDYTDLRSHVNSVVQSSITAVIEGYYGKPFGDGLQYVLYVSGDYAYYSYEAYCSDAQGTEHLCASGNTSESLVELYSGSATIDTIRAIVTPYSNDNTAGKTIEVNEAKFPITVVDKKGTINTHGGIVPGYDSSYVIYKSNTAKIRDSLENGWHITAVRQYNDDEITWYELYDTDDNDYYGWVDSDFIDFYSEEIPPSSTQTNYTLDYIQFYEYKLRELMKTAGNNAMFDLLDMNNDGILELIFSPNTDHTTKCTIFNMYSYEMMNVHTEKLVEVGNIGEIGHFWYYNNENIIGETWGNQGTNKSWYYKLEGSNLIEIFSEGNNLAADNGSENFNPCFWINGKEVSEDIYYKECDEFLSEYNLTTRIDVGRKYLLDEATISEVFKNYAA